MCLTSLIALYWPADWYDPFSNGGTSLPYVICATMFCIGLLLPRDEVRNLQQRWPTVLGGTLVQYTSMPLLAYLVTLLFPLSDDLRLGIVMVGCVPGAMASNVLTLMAKGNVSYSVSLTTTATLLSPIFVPIILSIFLGEAATPKKNTAWLLCWTVVIPVITGHLVGRQFEGQQKKFSPIAKIVASLTLLWIIAVVVGKNRETLAGAAALVVLALLLINVGGYAIGLLAGWSMKLEPGMRRALALEIGMQNAGLGTVLASQSFPDRPTMLIPTVLYTFGCMLTGTMLAGYWNATTRQAVED